MNAMADFVVELFGLRDSFRALICSAIIFFIYARRRTTALSNSRKYDLWDTRSCLSVMIYYYTANILASVWMLIFVRGALGTWVIKRGSLSTSALTRALPS